MRCLAVAESASPQTGAARDLTPDRQPPATLQPSPTAAPPGGKTQKQKRRNKKERRRMVAADNDPVAEEINDDDLLLPMVLPKVKVKAADVKVAVGGTDSK